MATWKRITFAGETSGSFSNIQVDSGSAGAPSYSFTGDTNTGMWRTEADGLALGTNGTQALSINSSQTAIFSGDVYIPANLVHSGDNDTLIAFGTNVVQIEAGGTAPIRAEHSLVTMKAGAGVSMKLDLVSDNGSNHADNWRLSAETDHVFEIQTKDGGSWADVIELSSSDKKTYLKGDLSVSGNVWIGSHTLKDYGGDLTIESNGDDINIVGSWLRIKQTDAGAVKSAWHYSGQLTLGADAQTTYMLKVASGTSYFADDITIQKVGDAKLYLDANYGSGDSILYFKNSADNDNLWSAKRTSDGEFQIENGGTDALRFDTSRNAYFNQGLYSDGTLYVSENIRHTGDTNNYINFTTDTQKFYTDGTLALTLDSGNSAIVGGNVSVGGGQVITPSGVNLALNPNTGLVTVGGRLDTTTGANITGQAHLVATSANSWTALKTSGAIEFQTSSADGSEKRLTFAPGGASDSGTLSLYNGDGTTVGTSISGGDANAYFSSTSGKRLHVGTIEGNAGIEATNTSDSSDHLRLKGYTLKIGKSATDLVLDSDGNATFGSKVSVVGNTVGSSVYANFGPTTLDSSTREGGIQIHASSGSADKTWGIWADANNPIGLKFEYLATRATAFGSGTTVLTMDGANNRVGINRTSPTYTFDVNGDSLFTNTSGNLVRMTGAGNSSFYVTATGQITHVSTTGNTAFSIDQQGAGDIFAVESSKFIIKADGKTGIGTSSPGQTLSVQGDTYDNIGILVGSTLYGLITAQGGDIAIKSSNSNNIVFHTAGTERLKITDTYAEWSRPLQINTTYSDEQIKIMGTSPYIRFYEGGTGKAYLQWHADGKVLLENQETSSRMDLYGSLSFYAPNDGGSTEFILDNNAAAGSTDEKVGIRLRHASATGAVISSERTEDFSSSAAQSANLFFQTTKDGITNTKFLIKDDGSSEFYGSYVKLSNATNPYIYLNDTNGGAGIFQQYDAYTAIGSDSNHAVRIVQNNTPAITIDTSKNATFAGNVGIANGKYLEFNDSDGNAHFRIFQSGADVFEINSVQYGGAVFTIDATGGGVNIPTNLDVGAGIDVTGTATFSGGTIGSTIDFGSHGTSANWKTAYDFSQSGGTVSGDVQVSGLYVGSTNTTYDFYNNGTTYLNGATTIDANTSINGDLTVTDTNAEIRMVESGSSAYYVALTSYHNAGDSFKMYGIKGDYLSHIRTDDSDEDTHTLRIGGAMKRVDIFTNGTQRLLIDETGKADFKQNHISNWNSLQAQGGEFNIDNGGYIDVLGTKNLTFRTTDSNTARMVILSGGAVGIGTTSPTSDLEIKMATDKHMQFSDSQGETGNCPTIHAVNTAGNALVDLGFRGDNLIFATGSAERMRTTDTGLGIGVTPSYKLDVAGTARVGTTAAGGILRLEGKSGVSYPWQLETGTTGGLTFDSNTTDVLTLQDDGRVGVGILGPRTHLDVRSYQADGITIGADNDANRTRTDSTTKSGGITGVHYDNDEESIRIIGYSSTSSANQIYIGGANSDWNAATEIKFYTAANATTVTGTAALTIDSSRRVGIGTTSPDAGSGAIKLHIQSGSAGSVSAYDGDSIGLCIEASGNSGMQFLTGSNSDTRIWFGDANTTTSGAIIYTHHATATSENMDLRVNSSTRMRIMGDGSIGFGTTSPDADYHFAQGTHNRVLISSNGPTLVFKEDNTTDENWAFYHNAGVMNLMTMDDSYGSSSTKVSFLQNGNVGIGDTSPSYKLDIAGDYSNPSATAAATAVVGISAGASGSELVIGGEQSGGKVWIQNRHKSVNGYAYEIAFQPQGGTTSFGGPVGLGATPSTYHASADNFVIYESANAGMTIATSSTGTGSIFFADSGTGDEAYKGAIEYVHGSTNELQFRANSVKGMTLDASKNLKVEGNVSVPDTKKVGAGDDTDIWMTHSTHSYIENKTGELRIVQGSGDHFSIWTEPSGGSDTKRLNIAPDGVVTIYGNTEIQGTITLDTGEKLLAAGGYVVADGDAGFIARDSGSNKLIVNGNVIRGDANNVQQLGQSDVRWANIYSVLGDFSSNVTAGGNIKSTAGWFQVAYNNGYELQPPHGGYARIQTDSGNTTQARMIFNIKSNDGSEVTPISMIQNGDIGLGSDITDNVNMTGAALKIISGDATFSGTILRSATNNSAGTAWTVIGDGNIPHISIQNASTTNDTMAGLFFKDDQAHRAGIHAKFLNHTDGSEQAQLVFSTANNGGTRERMTIGHDGDVTINGGNNYSQLRIKSTGSEQGIKFIDSSDNTEGWVYANTYGVGFLDEGAHWTIKAQNNTGIYFYTNNESQHMQILNSGNVSIGNTNDTYKLDVTGTARFSTGVLFGSDSAAANTLHDYEEGNWTPVFTDEDNASFTASATIASAYYVKVGAQVTVWARIQNINNGDAEDQFCIKGLPFTVEAAHAGGTAMFSGWNFVKTGSICVYVRDDGVMKFFETLDNTAWSPITWSENDSSTNDMNFYATYRTTQ